MTAATVFNTPGHKGSPDRTAHSEADCHKRTRGPFRGESVDGNENQAEQSLHCPHNLRQLRHITSYTQRRCELHHLRFDVRLQEEARRKEV